MISILIRFNYNVDELLDAILNQALDSGINRVDSKGYFLNVLFNDGGQLNGWNMNKYHAWLSKGTYYFPKQEGDKDYDINTYKWENARPSRKTMNRILKEFSNFKYKS